MSDGSGGPGVRGQRDPGLERAIGARVRALREKAGLGREDMAARLGITPVRMRKLETATAIINVAVLQRIAQILGVRVGDFYPEPGSGLPQTRTAPGGSSRMRPVGPPAGGPGDPMAHPESLALIKAYYAAPAPVRANFLGLLQTFTAARAGMGRACSGESPDPTLVSGPPGGTGG